MSLGTRKEGWCCRRQARMVRRWRQDLQVSSCHFRQSSRFESSRPFSRQRRTGAACLSSMRSEAERRLERNQTLHGRSYRSCDRINSNSGRWRSSRSLGSDDCTGYRWASVHGLDRVLRSGRKDQSGASIESTK